MNTTTKPEHTPLRLNRHGYATHYITHEFLETPDGGSVCGFWSPDGNTEQVAWRDRLMACHNALAGLNPEAVGAVVEALELAEKQMTLIAISHKIDVEKEIRDYPTCPLAIVRAAMKAVKR